MKKSSNIVMIIVVALLIICSIIFISILNKPQPPKETTDYKLSDYSVVVNINDGGQIDISETFSVTYNTNHLHGVQRYIPLKVTAYYNENGKIFKKKYKTKIANAYSKDSAYKGQESGYFYFNLGSANKYVEVGEKKTYSLSYTIVLPDDRLSDKDVFYYNVLPFDWDAPISNASFEINYNFKTIDKDYLQDMTAVYFGKVGSTERLDNVVFEKSKISGSVAYLEAFSGVTIYTELKDGSLGTKTNKYLITSGIIFALLILCAVICFYTYKKTHKFRPIITTVEFKAPDGLTPAECGYIIDGHIDNRDFVSMLVYWGSRGYLKIEEKKKKITLYKLKNLPESAKSFEKTLFGCIFSNGDKVNIKDIPNFGENLDLARAQLKNDIKHNTFDLKSKINRTVFSILTAVVPALATYIVFKVTLIDYAFLVSVIEGIIIFLATRTYNFACDKAYFNKTKVTYAYKICSYLVLIAILIGNLFAYEFYVDSFLTLILSHLLALILMYMSGNVLTRTEASVKNLGKILGLKNFILYTEKDRMEMLVKDNPQLFYDILPYAYALNVTDVYCEKFDGINLTTPEWYVSDMLIINDFHSLFLLSTLDRTLSSTTSYLTNVTTQNAIGKAIETANKMGGGGSGSSGGGLSGGGFGGGGFGGGGGRGW